jgi:hypothetical protein
MGIIPGLLTAIGLNKTVAYLIEILLAVAIVAGASLYVAHLYQKAEAFDDLSAEHNALELKYGCDKRPSIAERELRSCLIARDLDGEKARREEIEHQRDEAAKAQAELDAQTLAAERQQWSENEILSATPAADDGRVPKVLLDAWARERRRLGVSK